MAVLSIDSERRIIKQASAEKIRDPWKKVVDEVVESARTHLGSRLVSVYIGGSVATGTAREGESDVDGYLIVDLTNDEIEEAEQGWVKEERKRIHAAHSFLRGVEMHLSPRAMKEGRKFQIRVLAAHVFGEDVGKSLPEYRLDRDTLARVRVDIARDVRKAQAALASPQPGKAAEKTVAWIAKRLLRSWGMLALWKGDTFTMDLDPLASRIAHEYPEKQDELQKLRAFIAQPPDANTVLEFLDSFGPWLFTEDERVFETKK